MKKIIFLLLIISSAKAQTKAFQVRDFVYLYNSATISVNGFCDAGFCSNTLKTVSDTLATIHYDGLVIWRAALAAADVSDTLSASGIPGICRVTIPTNVTAQRIIQYESQCIIFSSATYRIVYPTTSITYPLVIKRISDNVTMCTIYNSWAIDWGVTPSVSWFGRVGTTRIKRITLP